MICKYIRLASAYSEKEQNRIIDDYLRKKGWVADTIVKDDTILKVTKDHPLLSEGGWRAYDVEDCKRAYGRKIWTGRLCRQRRQRHSGMRHSRHCRG